MTAQTTAPAPAPVVTPLADADIKRIGRYLYSLAVQGSRLDLMTYDTQTEIQEWWTRKAHRLVRRIEASGRNVTIEG